MAGRSAAETPREVYATLLDNGEYLCSVRTMYRILLEEKAVRERRNQLTHPNYRKDSSQLYTDSPLDSAIITQSGAVQLSRIRTSDAIRTTKSSIDLVGLWCGHCGCLLGMCDVGVGSLTWRSMVDRHGRPLCAQVAVGVADATGGFSVSLAYQIGKVGGAGFWTGGLLGCIGVLRALEWLACPARD